MIYTRLQEAGFDVLIDDRNERPGVMFAELDLIGIPHRLVVGERGLKNGSIEYKHRSTEESVELPVDEVIQTLVAIRENN